MKLIDRLRVGQGQIIGNGIHWRTSPHSRLAIFIRAWKIALSIRFLHGRRWPRLYLSWPRTSICPGVEFSFDRDSILVNGIYISLELLDAMTVPDPARLHRFERKGNIVIVTTFPFVFAPNTAGEKTEGAA